VNHWDVPLTRAVRHSVESRRGGRLRRLKSGVAAFLALSVAIGVCIAAIALGFNLALVIIIVLLTVASMACHERGNRNP
jgi:hypothetical protein